jgi:hypothetical protein
MGMWDLLAGMSSPIEVGDNRSLFKMFKEIRMNHYLMVWIEGGVHQVIGVSLVDNDLDGVVVGEGEIAYHPLIKRISLAIGKELPLSEGISFEEVSYHDESFIEVA